MDTDTDMDIGVGMDGICGRTCAVSTCASFDRGDSGPDRGCPHELADGERDGGERGETGNAFMSGTSACVVEGVGGGGGGVGVSRCVNGLRGRGKWWSIFQGRCGDEGRAKTPSRTNVGDGGAVWFDRRLRSSDGLGPASVVRGTRGFVSFEHSMAVLGKDGRRAPFESEVVDAP